MIEGIFDQSAQPGADIGIAFLAQPCDPGAH